MAFQHIVITQFNLRNFPKSNNAETENWIRWTRNRIQIFNDYCLPSMVNQSCRDFTWLLYFDSETPEEFSDFIRETAGYDFIQICYSRGNEDFYAGYMAEVNKRVRPETEWLLTTRIDNDDCLHRDAIRVIQTQFRPQHGYLISLASGYVLNLAAKTLSHYFYPMSPFLSLVENIQTGCGGVFQKGHTKWDELRLFIHREIRLAFTGGASRKAMFVLNRPLWIQLVHGDNVSNSFYRGLPVLSGRDLKEFSIPFSTVGQPLSVVPKYYQYVTWKRYFKSWVVKCIVRN
jgi:hypothetical protein